MSSFFYAQKKILKILKTVSFVFLLFILAAATIINPVAIQRVPAKQCYTHASSFPSIKKIIQSLFHKPESKKSDLEPVSVYVGGNPLGFTFDLDGVLVVAISNDDVENLKEGDIIKKLCGQDVKGVDDIAKILDSVIDKSQMQDLVIVRNNDEQAARIKPVYDEIAERYKLGIWIRDSAAGVGTLTYIRKDNMRFGALGHPVCDIDTGSIMPISEGNIFKCNVVGLKKGAKKKPGELKGLFLRNGSKLGSLDKNNTCGVFGKFEEKQLDFINGEEMEVASKYDVKSGKAVIRCTIDGYEPRDYEIEIVKTYFQSNSETKSMFIRVTDKELLEKTGGIIQGMSGSPIIQNGKLVGAVTHVFVSDPTKGYGIFAENMINK